MKPVFAITWFAAATFLLPAACSRRSGVKPELAEVERTLAAATNSAPEAGVYFQAADSAVRQNDYAGGVMALQAVQQLPTATPEQLKAVHGAIQALTDDLVNRAARGDAQAQAALAAIERSRSQ